MCNLGQFYSINFVKYKELTTKEEAELKKTLFELKSEVQELELKLSLNESKQSHKLRNLKKDIARILTAIGQKASN